MAQMNRLSSGMSKNRENGVSVLYKLRHSMQLMFVAIFGIVMPLGWEVLCSSLE